jgi:hypothetical protein
MSGDELLFLVATVVLLLRGTTTRPDRSHA